MIMAFLLIYLIASILISAAICTISRNHNKALGRLELEQELARLHFQDEEKARLWLIQNTTRHFRP